MEIDELEIVELELKYCERCGALWLRHSGSDQVYCATCMPKMLDCPTLRKSRASQRLAISRDFPGMEHERLAVLPMEGGKA